MLSRAEFEEECVPLRLGLEQRRRRHLRYFYGGIVAGVLALAGGMLFPEASLNALQGVLHRHVPLTPYDILACRIFSVFFTGFIILSPVMGYAGEHGLSVERALAARLLTLLGAFTPMARGGISAAEIRRLNLTPEPLLLYPDAGAAGEMNGMRVRFCTGVLVKRADVGDTVVFNGLLLFCDLGPRSSAKLDATGPQDAALKVHLAGLASDNTASEPQRWDEKMNHAVQALYARLRRRLIFRLGRGELPQEKAYRLKYETLLPLVRLPAPEVQNALLSSFAILPLEEGCFVAMAGRPELFAMGSLFRPALPPARIEALYDAMQAIDWVTRRMTAI